MGQGLQGYQNSSLRIISIISLCTFTVISPKNILGIHNPNEIWFVKGRQSAMILSSGNIMGKGFGICYWEELGSSALICQQHDREFECPKELVRRLINNRGWTNIQEALGNTSFICSSTHVKIWVPKEEKYRLRHDIYSSCSVHFGSRGKWGLYAIHLRGHNINYTFIADTSHKLRGNSIEHCTDIWYKISSASKWLKNKLKREKRQS